ncbi:hypothetical protein HOD20_01840 [archaeon]|jgi:exosortase/archaeosortase family protein|nr:hypothetical protein [archaeon]MBT4351247.1 hypothetical protein [archaeon]MBT4648133.1 hypothetical protein [archaeon]MBT6822449.1 hypothetical protein [archaeon]MBT7392101.1 hypothetical protein [archaeon]
MQLKKIVSDYAPVFFLLIFFTFLGLYKITKDSKYTVFLIISFIIAYVLNLIRIIFGTQSMDQKSNPIVDIFHNKIIPLVRPIANILAVLLLSGLIYIFWVDQKMPKVALIFVGILVCVIIYFIYIKLKHRRRW